MSSICRNSFQRGQFFFYRFSNSEPELKISNLNPEKGQLAARLPFLEDNCIHLSQILKLSSEQKSCKNTLKSLFDAYLATLKVSPERNQQLFKSTQAHNQELYTHIKQTILVEGDEGFDPNSDFMKYAHYYFMKEGKKVRPLMIRLLAESLTQTELSREASKRQNSIEIDTQTLQNREEVLTKIKDWGALIEILHIASLAHDDIIDDSPSRRGQESQHLKYGKRSAVFSGNYIISKARSQKLYDFASPRLYEIYSISMDNLATGEIIQALTKNKVSEKQGDIRHFLETYMNKTYYKTAALMANSLRAVPLIIEKVGSQKESSNLELQCFRVGQHFGIAFQIVDDILDYISSEAEMGKEEVADIRQGNVTAPVYFTLYSERKSRGGTTQNPAEHKTVEQVVRDLKRKNKSKEEALQIRSWVHQGTGIELSYLLAYKHIETGLSYLRDIGICEKGLGPWKFLAFKLLTRTK